MWYTLFLNFDIATPFFGSNFLWRVKKSFWPLTPRRGRQVQGRQAGQEADPMLRLQAPRSSASWQRQSNSSQGTTSSCCSPPILSTTVATKAPCGAGEIQRWRIRMCVVNSVLSVLRGEQSGDSDREVNIQDNGTKVPSVLQTYLFEHLSHALPDKTLNGNQDYISFCRE